jgi:hypothetical protein
MSFPWRIGRRTISSKAKYEIRFDAWKRARMEVRLAYSISPKVKLTDIAAGAQWLAFRDNTGSHSKRTCPGAMDQDNTDYTFKIEWELSNANNE